VRTDVSKAAEVETLIHKIVETYGRLDYAHDNAGIAGADAPTADCTEENWDHTIAINLTGVWLCMKYEIPQMLRQGGGAIVNTASTAGLVGLEGAPAYCASKGGVVQLTRGGIGLRESPDSRERCMPWRHSHADGRASCGYGSGGRASSLWSLSGG
jgi:NAD(P)-dependent dehydrogenase (short-subunit alcohol dehydrogenase family)